MAAPVVLTPVTVLIFVISQLSAQTVPTDVKKEARGVLMYARDIVTRAKGGSPIESILTDVRDLQTVTVNLARLPLKEKCETQSVINIAANGVGSHVVLGVMVAEDYEDVLSTRLGLGLAFVDRVAQMMEDKLSLSSDVGPELTAIIFGTNTTASVISSADKTIQNEIIMVGKKSRSKRQAVSKLGRGFDVSNHVILWKDTIGEHSIDIPPWARDPSSRGHHVSARSPQGWNAGITGEASPGSGKVQGNLGWTSPDGRFSAGVNGGVGWSGGQIQPNAGFSLNFKF